jgi:hypothetical protein
MTPSIRKAEVGEGRGFRQKEHHHVLVAETRGNILCSANGKWFT